MANKIKQYNLVLYALKSFYHSEICRFDKITDAFTGGKFKRINNNRFLRPILKRIHLFFVHVLSRQLRYLFQGLRRSVMNRVG